MDERTRPSLHQRVLGALATLLPDELRSHPDARALLDADTLPAVDEARLLPLTRALSLSQAEQLAVTLAVWVEFDAPLASALALLQGNAERSGAQRPTLGLIASLAARLPTPDQLPLSPALAMSQILQGPAMASGLLQLVAEGGQASDLAHSRLLQLPQALLALLANPNPPVHPTRLGRLVLRPITPPAWPMPQAWQHAANTLAATLKAATSPCVVVLRGADAHELAAWAAALAPLCGQRAYAVQSTDADAALSAEALAQWAAWEGVVPALIAMQGWPVWHAELAPGSALHLPPLAHWHGPLIVLGGVDTALQTDLPLHELDLPMPDARDRLALWRAIVATTTNPTTPTPNQPCADLRAVKRSRCGLSVLAQAATLAGTDVAAPAAIEQAVRASARSLSAWAQVSDDHIPADAWVGPPSVHRELGLLLTRCLARGDASAPLGPLLRGRLSHGVKALFIGASGTGKTLAAQWLADRLARPLVRVDLAAVVSKYIGETEKNLSQLLSRAEHLDAVLLFDEADSLFGARTDVKQANDRYANMQTNYLLQRLETFHGVAVLTSNSKARFDDAFLRRLDTVIEFPLPDVAERRALWSLHLGESPQLDPAVLNTVAALADLPGGHIRNAVLTAALLARQRRYEALGDADDTPPQTSDLQADDLREALALEYHKLGQRPPDSL
ncbi:ATP-binding protein [Rhodoferax sp. U2-2l]|uniref:ATP-binding protein n=1 Tax=Rhodoferax sp. U2-2l TaxID=2884000 RepID=UPI001D0ACE94|nr:ATP-binding protein [Rhodoferax sp. U2-2l]MCB8745458.1 ATP-binding protein [Rhodoferax sp. U2-2l]